ncbi:acetyl-CoA carboxylase, carboxyltransferase subunit beta [Nocardia bovistercoris]|uniref:Multifunctional fusion protein n=1 Tax=Nocardia bovistercoris TaxID=2785916 RepID=A0A931I755_9NOCA|nr:acetyl-CoA carboxylase, carboxyltransferase subunit beta [Nocardia bovistercoris]MBH0775481.1 acetyl-CoA carboxylase carboxyltransferase subunit beta [Nocardia bovistercoris]
MTELLEGVSRRHTDQETTWVKCPSCSEYQYKRRLERNLRVCAGCGHHLRITAARRLAILLDENSWESGDHEDIETEDILEFRDRKTYRQRLDEARRKTGAHDAAVFGSGTLAGHRIAVAAMEFGFMGGSMGSAVGEVVTRAAEFAVAERLPLLLSCASGGARMQEGGISLMQMAKTSQAIARMHEEGLLVLCLLTDPTFGGVTASFAMLGDILVAEPGALIGFAGPNVIRQTINADLPPGFQTAEFLLERGMLDAVVPRPQLRSYLAKVLTAHAVHAPAGYDAAPVIRTDPDQLTARPPEAVIKIARDRARPTTLGFAAVAFDSFFELRGDRLFGDSAALVGGPAIIAGRPVMLIGHEKGSDTKESIARNFGMPEPEGYRKALRLMRHAAKFGMPIVTLIDTPGAYPGLGAEERGQAGAIAQAIMESSRLPVPIVAVVTGEGGSGGALALGVADRVLMFENSYYSVISPEGCAAILWGDRGAAAQAAHAMRITAPELLRLGVVDGVVPEPETASDDVVTAAANLRAAVAGALAELSATPDLVAARYRKFRRFGIGSPSMIGAQS